MNASTNPDGQRRSLLACLRRSWPTGGETSGHDPGDPDTPTSSARLDRLRARIQIAVRRRAWSELQRRLQRLLALTELTDREQHAGDLDRELAELGSLRRRLDGLGLPADPEALPDRLPDRLPGAEPPWPADLRPAEAT